MRRDVIRGVATPLSFLLLLGASGAMAAAGEGHLPPDVPEFWPSVAGDLRQVTWAHAVNSRKELNEALSGNIMMLEADVSVASDGITPIMAHPPATQSDLKLEDFLNEINGTKKGAKLDFKTTEAFQLAVPVLEAAAARGALEFPLWLNADIAAGPNGTAPPNVSAADFLALSTAKFPGRTLSVGWTTGDSGDRYTQEQVDAMEKALQAANVSASLQPLTFPVRAAPAARSADALLPLLQAHPRASLTLWGAAADEVDNEALLQLAQNATFGRVYVDLPNAVPGLTPGDARGAPPSVPAATAAPAVPAAPAAPAVPTRGDPRAPADAPTPAPAPGAGGSGAAELLLSPLMALAALATAVAAALRRY